MPASPGRSPSETKRSVTAPSTLSESSRHLSPRHKVWLNWDGKFLMGPNYLRFLSAVDRAGTIREGGHAVGWSYRTCLNRLRRMERALGRPILLTTRGGKSGGGARLTAEARRFVRIFDRWQQDVNRISSRAFRQALRKTMGR
jgi:molybdate transport system regulatory protein